MKFTVRCLLLAAVPLTALAQGDLFEKAPPHIDEALRERVKLFYQAHVDGKFRLADSVVHEDSKDAFFAAQKDQYLDFEIVRIQYSDEFQKASVVVAVDTDFVMPGFGKRRVKMPVTTLWKFDGGEWWWHVTPPEQGIETPFGVMKAGPDSEKQKVYERIAAMPNADQIRSQVAASKSVVNLSGYEPSEDEVVIRNGMPGAVSLRLDAPTMLGLEVVLDKTELAGKEEARITFRYEPPQPAIKPPLEARVHVSPTGLVIPISIEFAVPPEVREKIEQLR